MPRVTHTLKLGRSHTRTHGITNRSVNRRLITGRRNLTDLSTRRQGHSPRHGKHELRNVIRRNTPGLNHTHLSLLNIGIIQRRTRHSTHHARTESPLRSVNKYLTHVSKSRNIIAIRRRTTGTRESGLLGISINSNTLRTPKPSRARLPILLGNLRILIMNQKRPLINLNSMRMRMVHVI